MAIDIKRKRDFQLSIAMNLRHHLSNAREFDFNIVANTVKDSLTANSPVFTRRISQGDERFAGKLRPKPRRKQQSAKPTLKKARAPR